MGLIHWWPLNGDLYDYAQGNHLQYINDNGKLTSDNNGKLGKCWLRSAINSNDLLRSISKSKICVQQSIAAWVYVTTVANTSTANGLITNHSHNDNSGFGLTLKTNSNNEAFLSCNTGSGSGRTYHSYYGTTNLVGAWHHICGTYDGNHIRLYVDGVCEKTQAYSMLFIEDYWDLFNWSTTHYTNASYRPACKLCDVRVYDHALSPTEIAELKRGLLLHYNFESQLSKEYDCSGHEYNATINGVTLSSDTAIGAHSGYFSNGQQWLEHSEAPYDAFEIGISMWVKSNNTSPKNGYHILLAIDAGRVELSIPSNGQLRWGGYINSTRYCGNVTCKNSSGSTFSLLNNEWHHIVTTYDGTGWKGYVDGVYQGIQSCSGSISYNGKTLRIGKYTAGATSNYGATDMYIADVKIYNTALTQDDVTSLYNHTVKISTEQVMIGNYLTENNSDLNFQDLSVWKRTGHGERVRVLEDGVELAAVNGWRNFAVEVPSDMVGQNLIFSFDYKWNDNNRPYIGAWIWTNNSNSYTGSIYALKYTTDDLPAGQWTHCSVPISAAKNYVGINNRVQDGSGMTAPLVLRNISLQLASGENVQVFPTGKVECSRYGDSNKTRIIKSGALTAETFIEI